MSAKRGASARSARRVLRTLTRSAVASLALLLGVSTAWAATEIPPAPTRWVTDNAGFLSAATRAALDQRLEEYERQSGHQVLVWIGTTLNGVPIEDFAVHAFEKWRVGRKGIDDGLVLFIFAQDRKMRIEVGYGLEGRVPDIIASRIIRDTIAPQLQAGNRDAALTAGVDAILDAIRRGVAGVSEAESEAQTSSTPYSGGRREAPAATLGQKVLFGIIAIVFLFMLITHPRLTLWILFNILTSSRGGGGGGGFGGGSSFSGGGGRSGGGGASGSW